MLIQDSVPRAPRSLQSPLIHSGCALDFRYEFKGPDSFAVPFDSRLDEGSRRGPSNR